MRSNRLLAGAVLAVAALTLSACGTSSSGKSTPVAEVSPTPSSDTAAIVLDRPFAKPDLTLTDSDGKPYNLVKQTAGKPTLLYFGYTHCPDVCPTTMADLAEAKTKLPAAERGQVQVVFVSTDPTRDTPKRLKAWLGSMDPAFVGLTGNFPAIQAAAKSLGVLVEKPVKEKDGSISVEHGAEVFAFSPKDDEAHFLYTSGVTVAQYAHDLPDLIKGVTP